MDLEKLKRELGLQPHPEGGFYVQTYKSAEKVAAEALPQRYGGARAISTAIYYLLEPGTFSEMHTLQSDEIFHFYMGDPVEMLQLSPDGTGRVVKLGADVSDGMRPQVVVPRGVWQGSRLVPGGIFALLGCTVAPGFEFEDYVRGSRVELTRAYPAFAEMISALTRD